MTPVAAQPSTFQELALGHAHRRNRVFLFWWMGMVFAIPGAVQAAVLAAMGLSAENGLMLAVWAW